MNIAKEIEAEPIGWLLQDQDTGRVSFCPNDGVNNLTNFVANNPQYILCTPAYAHPAAPAAMVDEIEGLKQLVRHLTGNPEFDFDAALSGKDGGA